MRIHSDTLTWTNLYDAARLAKVQTETLREHGSRSRDHAFEVALRGNSNRRPNFYNGDGQYAATWDQWGVFLGRLFELDPHMLIGSGTSAEDLTHFEYHTAGRFSNPRKFEHPLNHDHVFRYKGVHFELSCTRCGAITRWES